MCFEPSMPKSRTKSICQIDPKVGTSDMKDSKFAPSLWEPLHFKTVITILLPNTAMSAIITLWELLAKVTNHHLHQEIATLDELPWLPTNFNQLLMTMGVQIFKGNWTISYIRIFAQQHIEPHYGKWRKKPRWIDHDEGIYLARQKINLYATK
jgi:hypothetical protein